MMKLREMLHRLLNRLKSQELKPEPPADESIYGAEKIGVEESEGYYSIWDFLKFHEHTQAYHLANVIGFEEWVDMEEVRRRIKELFNAEYKHDKSLYPYLKTLVDVGLMETSNVGGRRRWRKADILIKTKKRKAEKEQETEKANN